MKVINLKPSHLKPYEELSVEWSGQSFKISTPWIALTVSVDADQIHEVKRATEDLEKRDYSSHSLQQFLKFFRSYPTSYALPRDISSIQSAGIHYEKSLDVSEPMELIRFVECGEYEGRLSSDWIIDPKEILDKTRIEGTDLYDPVSVYTHLTRLRLKAETEFKESAQIQAIAEEFLRSNEDDFFSLVSFMLKQTYYITHRCDEALSPATTATVPSSKLVEQFRIEELGHDRLIEKSLNELGSSASIEDDILPSTKLSMNILRFAAQEHFLAFSCIVGAFEGNDYGDMDPLAEQLLRSSKPRAADGIQKHFLINKHGNHGLVGETFLRDLGPVNEPAVVAAVRLTDLVISTGFEMVHDLIAQGERIRNLNSRACLA